MVIWWIVPVYMLLFCVEKRRGISWSWLFALLEGVFLAEYSFYYLPQIFIWNLTQATIWVLLGILLGSALEEFLSKGLQKVVSPIVFLCCIVLYDVVSYGFVHGVLGGIGLYLSASALLPDIIYKKENFTMAFGGIVGFLLGTILLFYTQLAWI